MYIDPNTGGMLFQVLATSLALISGLVLLFSGRIRAFIARLRRSARGDAAETGDEAPGTQSISSDDTAPHE